MSKSKVPGGCEQNDCEQEPGKTQASVQNNTHQIQHAIIFQNMFSVALEMKLRKKGREGGRKEEWN